MAYKIVDGKLVEDDREFISISSPKKILFDALVSNVKATDDLLRENGVLRAKVDALKVACNVVPDDVSRLDWLQALITEVQRHPEIGNDDVDAALTCIAECQQLHDALKKFVEQ